MAQAVMCHRLKARGQGHPHVSLPAQQPFRFDHPRDSPIKDTPRDGGSNLQPSPHWPQGAETVIDIGGTKGLHHLGSHHLPWTVGSRVTGIHYQWLPQCHPGLIDQMDPSIPSEGDSTERMELT